MTTALRAPLKMEIYSQVPATPRDGPRDSISSDEEVEETEEFSSSNDQKVENNNSETSPKKEKKQRKKPQRKEWTPVEVGVDEKGRKLFKGPLDGIFTEIETKTGKVRRVYFKEKNQRRASGGGDEDNSKKRKRDPEDGDAEPKPKRKRVRKAKPSPSEPLESGEIAESEDL